jgi:outer membrane protein OmpA-like peptidoglycan-associated protein
LIQVNIYLCAQKEPWGSSKNGKNTYGTARSKNIVERDEQLILRHNDCADSNFVANKTVHIFRKRGQTMRNLKAFRLLLVLLVGLILIVPSIAQEQEKKQTTQDTQTTKQTTSTQDTQTTKQSDQTTSSGQPASIESGKKQKIAGIIVKRDGDKLVLRDRSRNEVSVNLTGTTKIEERKKNPFRGAKQYDQTALVRGLWVEVEGRGSDSSTIAADKIKFTDTQYQDAAALESRVDPVEDRVGETENRITQSEQNQQRLSGQLQELSAVANTARGGAKAAQETADKAIAEVGAANQRIDSTNQRVSAVDERITTLDDYEAKNTVNVTFKVNRAILSDEAKASLDEVANQAKNEKGYVIQVAGFASADGKTDYNRRLSERRADAVIRYLVDNHDIPLRRIITPYGYGELKPAGDNATREGREQNRRVEVSVLVSKGLTSPAGGGEASRQRTTSGN